MKVTNELIKAMKQASSIVWRLTNNENIIECHKGYDITHTFRYNTNNTGFEACFVDLHPSYNGAMNALLYILKKDDILTMHCMTNNNQYLDENNLFADELRISIHRKDKTIVDRMIIKSSITPDNSAKAIKKV